MAILSCPCGGDGGRDRRESAESEIRLRKESSAELEDELSAPRYEYGYRRRSTCVFVIFGLVMVLMLAACVYLSVTSYLQNKSLKSEMNRIRSHLQRLESQLSMRGFQHNRKVSEVFSTTTKDQEDSNELDNRPGSGSGRYERSTLKQPHACPNGKVWSAKKRRCRRKKTGRNGKGRRQMRAMEHIRAMEQKMTQIKKDLKDEMENQTDQLVTDLRTQLITYFNNLPTTNSYKVTEIPKKAELGIRAAHFGVQVPDHAKRESQDAPLCKDYPKFELCPGARTFRTKDDYTTLNFFQPADWLNLVNAPIFLTDGGDRFKVKTSGMYLIYSLVMFRDNRTKLVVWVEVNDKIVSRCMQSQENTGEVRYNTCSMFLALPLKEGDNITVVNSHKNTIISLSPDATYFGVVFLGGDGKT